MPSERPVRNASSSSAAGCLPCPRRAEPWPNAGTTAPVGNFTVRLAPLEAVPVAGSTADASEDATKEPSATQSPLNSRRFSNRIPYSLYHGVPCANRGRSRRWFSCPRLAHEGLEGCGCSLARPAAPNFGSGVSLLACLDIHEVASRLVSNGSADFRFRG